MRISRADATRALLAMKVLQRTSGGLSQGPNSMSNQEMLAFYGHASERFTLGQIVDHDDERWRQSNWVSKLWYGRKSGRVTGFSKQTPWCMWVLVDGTKHPARYSHTFWKPR